MDLELKHIVPYLPYGLKMAYRVKDEVFEPKGTLQTVSFFADATHQERVTLQGMDSEHIWMFKPILKPLSLLNDNFHSDFDTYFDENNYMVIENGSYGISCFEGDGISDGIGIKQPIGLLDMLFKHHFDVFGLIPKGLAIAE